ncbi:MAG TPA: aminopeptidase [Clostridiaceae bacterium]|nr:aminopeptidase [Clostridiaceae bacterium]
MIEQQEKKRRGRPRKNTIESVDQNPVQAKRGRGRPRKSETAALTAGGSKIIKTVNDLEYKPVNVWDNPAFKKEKIMAFSEDYKSFMNKAKTEREFIKESVALAKKYKFVDIDELGNKKLKPGDKVYRVVRDKLLLLAVAGKRPAEEGTKIVGAHVDSPRIDIKQNPLYESTDMVFFKTHYYGGVKKYQWLAIPLALHGVIVKADGTRVEVNIGEDENDPVFTITDLLPHLAKDQYEKKLNEAFQGENMNVLLGSEPIEDKEAKDRFKKNILNLLNEKYGIVEEDLVSSELQVVPAFKARDIGIDRSMVGAYGHDDRVCAYTALMAVLETEDPEYTAICYLTDKEEIGSVGNTGAESRALENFIAELCYRTTEGQYTDLLVRKALDRSKMLSADVNAAVDPNYEGTHDKLNAGYLGKGIAIMKYSGSRGKAGASDASAEYLGEIRRLFNENNIPWHITELGAVDKGGGGTIAMMIANLGVDVIDVGVPLLSMHAPYEVASKADIYAAYQGYRVFFGK